MNKTEMAVALFDKCADIYQEKYMDVSHYHDTLDTFCDLLTTPHASILELACGPGNITQYLLAKRPDYHILATDLSPRMLQLAGANNPTAECQLMDCRDIAQLPQKFHAIMCGFCLPYLSREEAMQLIADAATVLHPGGSIYLSTMEDDYSKSGLQTSSTGDQLYMHYHEAGYLTEALQNSGFTIRLLHRQPFTGPSIPATDLIIIAQL